MKLTLIMFCIVLIQGVCCYVLCKWLDKQRKENKRLKAEIETHVANVKVITEWAEKLNELEAKRRGRESEIDKAKTDEEIMSVVNTIIADNNKLCNKG